jgi:hypothetical protein
VRTPAARAFVHSLNILVKYVRLYGFRHKRTQEQFQVTWGELRGALPATGNSGLLLGVSGKTLLLDGVPLDTGQSERSFAQLLSTAGLASIHFSNRIAIHDFTRLVRAFAAGGSKAEVVADQIKKALGSDKDATIRVNEIRFVAQDPSAPEIPLAVQLAAQNLGPEAREWLNEPQKLLQLIAAAEGAKQAAPSPTTPSPLKESEVVKAIRLITRFGEVNDGSEAIAVAKDLKREISSETNLQGVLQSMLEQLAAKTPQNSGDTPLLMRAAEHLAIRFAMEQYERGEVRVNSIHELLERMSRQMESLRKLLRANEDKMSRAGLLVESHADILDRQFWAEVPESGKRSVLLSQEAACVPPRNIIIYIEELEQRGDQEAIVSILRNYVDCIATGDAESRRKAATGLSQLADLYVGVARDLLPHAIRTVSEQVTTESGMEIQSLLSAAFVRISQEAADQRQYAAVQEILASLQRVENERPVLAQELRPRVGIENRLPEFIEEALQLPHVPADLVEVLRRTPKVATEQIAERFSRCGRREECDRLFELVSRLTEDGARHLRETLRVGAVRQAASCVGLLTRISPLTVLDLLPSRLREWNRFYHDTVVRQIAMSNAPERGQILFELLDVLDQAVLPQAVDEIGLSGDRALTSGMIVLADVGATAARSPFLQVKAIEALGRLHDDSAVPVLRSLVESRKMWKWLYPRELRLAAAQALLKIEAQYGPQLVTEAGFSPEELDLLPLDAEFTQPWVRQRRYQRVLQQRMLPAMATSSWGRTELGIRELSLGGGLAKKDDELRLGSDATLELQLGLRHVLIQALLRRARQGEVSFEIVDMDLEERSKLRRLLTDQIHRIAALPN